MLGRFRLKKIVVAPLVALIVIASGFVTATPAAATGVTGHNKTIVGHPTSVGTNEEFTYRINLSCSSNTDNCGVVTLTDPLPAEVDYVSSSGTAGWTGSYDAGSSTVTVTKNDGSAMDDGDSIVMRILVKVRF